MHDDLRDKLDRFFGDYVGPAVRIEQTVFDADIDRARTEERRWQDHLQRYGDRETDRCAAMRQIADAREWLERLRATPPNRRLITRLECDFDAPGGPLARYTLGVWRERATEAA